MEEEVAKKTSPLPKVLGVAGFVLALASIAVGVMALTKAQKTVNDMNDKIEKAASLALEIKKSGDRIDSLALQIENLKSDDSKVDALSRQMKTYLESVGKIIQENRVLIEENRKAIQTLAENSSKARAPKQVAEAPKAAAEADSAQAPAQASTDGKVHKVKSGDSFSKIARQYGVSISAIQNANPNVNSAKMQIGQEIVIPAK